MSGDCFRMHGDNRRFALDLFMDASSSSARMRAPWTMQHCVTFLGFEVARIGDKKIQREVEFRKW